MLYDCQNGQSRPITTKLNTVCIVTLKKTLIHSLSFVFVLFNPILTTKKKISIKTNGEIVHFEISSSRLYMLIVTKKSNSAKRVSRYMNPFNLHMFYPNIKFNCNKQTKNQIK